MSTKTCNISEAQQDMTKVTCCMCTFG